MSRIKQEIPGLQGECFIHNATMATVWMMMRIFFFENYLQPYLAWIESMVD